MAESSIIIPPITHIKYYSNGIAKITRSQLINDTTLLEIPNVQTRSFFGTRHPIHIEDPIGEKEPLIEYAKYRDTSSNTIPMNVDIQINFKNEQMQALVGRATQVQFSHGFGAAQTQPVSVSITNSEGIHVIPTSSIFSYIVLSDVDDSNTNEGSAYITVYGAGARTVSFSYNISSLFTITHQLISPGLAKADKETNSDSFIVGDTIESTLITRVEWDSIEDVENVDHEFIVEKDSEYTGQSGAFGNAFNSISSRQEFKQKYKLDGLTLKKNKNMIAPVSRHQIQLRKVFGVSLPGAPQQAYYQYLFHNTTGQPIPYGVVHSPSLSKGVMMGSCVDVNDHGVFSVGTAITNKQCPLYYASQTPEVLKSRVEFVKYCHDNSIIGYSISQKTNFTLTNSSDRDQQVLVTIPHKSHPARLFDRIESLQDSDGNQFKNIGTKYNQLYLVDVPPMKNVNYVSVQKFTIHHRVNSNIIITKDDFIKSIFSHVLESKSNDLTMIEIQDKDQEKLYQYLHPFIGNTFNNFQFTSQPVFGQTTTYSGFGSSAPRPGFGLFGSQPTASTGFGSSPFGTQPTASTGFGFGTPTTSTGFGSSSFGAQPTTPTGFGSSSFGAQPTASTGFGSSAPTTSSFGFGTPTTSTGFGSSPFGSQPTASTGFGSSPFGTQPTASTGFGFGTPTTSTGFGSSSFGAQPTTPTGFGFGTQPTTSTGFGSSAPTASSFGSSTFGTQPTAPTSFGSSPFGTQPTTSTGFGSSSFGAQPTTSTGFGTQPTTSTGFGSSTPTTSTGFGSSTPTTSTGFGTQPTTSTGAAPPSTATGAPSSLFGSPQPVTGAPLLFGAPSTSTAAPSSLFGSPTPATGASLFGAPTATASSTTLLFGSSINQPTVPSFSSTQQDVNIVSEWATKDGKSFEEARNIYKNTPK